MSQNHKPTVLVILDGFGYAPATKYNAIAQAHMPNFKKWLTKYPHAILQAAGTAVGLPKGYIGNSEVGHLTIGAGRIIPQDLTRINNSIQDGSFFSNPTLVDNFTRLAQTGNSLHLMGLLSDSGVHSLEEHLFVLLRLAKTYNIRTTYIHAFLDGRDVPPKSAILYLERLQHEMNALGYGRLGSITGRFYALDRDRNWQRTQRCYDMLTQQQLPTFINWRQAIDYYYSEEITDEYVPPTQLDSESIVRDNDGIFFFDFRPDRARQLTQAFIDPLFNHFATKKYNLCFFITMTNYHQTPSAQFLFDTPKINNTLKEVLSNNHITIFSIAETEKYAHITYFFNGMREDPLPTETRVLIPSLPRQNYIECPQMSAEEITDAVINSLQTDPKNFYLINYANADMVGHSGNFDATVKAVEFLDIQLKRLYDAVIKQMNGTLYITADHGNAEDMFNPITQQPNPAHTTNPVYFLMIKKDLKGNNEQLDLHGLYDIAPFILHNLGLPIPPEMQTKPRDT